MELDQFLKFASRDTLEEGTNMNFRKLVFEYQDNIDINMKETL
jgi:uncharacterized protein YsxB (DUF464 family)